MKKARYICFEGTEGVGKTTQTNLIAQILIASGYKVLVTKEPGTPHAPLTMVLRQVMLDKAYDEQLTTTAREWISQSIRSIHLEKVIYPALSEYDFIIQDRGILSGLAYGVGCGNSEKWINEMAHQVVGAGRNPYQLYDNIVYLRGNVSKGLEKAQSAKQEFAAGDAIEAKGVNFLNDVRSNMDRYSERFNGVKYINVDGKNIQEVSEEIIKALDIKTGVNNGQEDK